MREWIHKIKQKILTTKKGKTMCVLLALYVVALLLIANDAWLYDTPIVKITDIKEEQSRTASGTREQKEVYYKQTMTGVVQNGKHKGKEVILQNEYSYSGVLDQKYQEGDQVFVGTNGDALSGTVKGLKRDVYLAALAGALMLLLVLISGKNGVLTIGTFFANLLIFAIGFFEFRKGVDMVVVSSLLAVFFTISTLILLNGIHRKTWAAVLSVVCVLVLIMNIFDIVTAYTPELDFASMEYLGSLEHPEELFRAEILLSGLGAIMDVAVTISTAMEEIINKNQKVSFVSLFRSGREIGYDIMGTMMNVLLFVFSCGLIPSFLICMNNDISFFTMVRLHIPFDICRFLIESIGIVLAIPVSILVASIFMKITFRRNI